MLKRKRTRLFGLLGLLVAALAIYASISGLVDPALYGNVVASNKMSEFQRIASQAQDIVTLPVSLLLACLCIMLLRAHNSKILITALGSMATYSMVMHCMQYKVCTHPST
jgi:phosphotransferase system  glucose/maltose/N-acetylglucosamine-specific IIC component